MRTNCLFKILLSLCLLASACSADSPLTQWELQPWPTDLYIFSNESSVLRVNQYIYGSAVSVSIVDQIEGVSAMSQFTEEWNSDAPEWSSSEIRVVRQVASQVGSWTGEQVSLLTNSTLIFEGTNSTQYLDLNLGHFESYRCFDLAVSPSLYIYVDCTFESMGSDSWGYTYLLLTISAGNGLKIVSTETYWTDAAPSDEVPLVLTNDFLFLYPKNSQNVSFVIIYLASHQESPQLYAVLDSSFFPSDSTFNSDYTQLKIRDLKVTLDLQSTMAFLNLEQGIFVFDPSTVLSVEPSFVEIPSYPAADPIGIITFEGYAVLVYISESDDQFESSGSLMLNLFDTATKKFKSTPISGNASELVSIETTPDLILVAYGKTGHVTSFSLFSAPYLESVGEWVQTTQNENAYSNAYLDFVYQKVFIFDAMSTNSIWKVTKENQILFNNLSSADGITLNVLIETEFGTEAYAEVYTSTLHVVESDQEGKSFASSQLIPGNGLFSTANGSASYQVPLEDFFGNFFSFSSNATNFSMKDTETLVNGLAVDVLLAAPMSHFSELIGVSGENGNLNVIPCDFNENMSVNCKEAILSGIAGNLDSASFMGEYFVVSDSKGIYFYDLAKGNLAWELTGASSCEPHDYPAIACVDSLFKTISIYKNTLEHPLNGTNPSPQQTIGSENFWPEFAFNPVRIIPGSSKGLLFLEDGKEGLLVISPATLRLSGLVTLLFVQKISLFDVFVTDGVLFNANENSIDLLDFNDLSSPNAIGSYRLPAPHTEGSGFSSSPSFLYISTSEGVYKLSKSAFSTMNVGVSLLGGSADSSFSLLVQEEREFLFLQSSQTLIKSNDYYSLQFDYSVPSQNVSSELFYINSSAQGSSTSFQYIFDVSTYNNSIKINTTKLSGNSFTIGEKASQLNISKIFEGSALYYDISPSNSTDKNTQIRITNTLNSISVLLNATADPQANLISSFTSFGSLILGLAPSRLFFWDPETLHSNGNFKFIFDLVLTTSEEYTCNGVFQLNENLLLVQCQTRFETILAIVSVLTGKPWLVEQINTGKTFEEIAVTESGVYCLRNNQFSQNIYNKQMLEVYQPDFSGTRSFLKQVGSVSIHTLNPNSISVQDLDVVTVGGNDLVLLTEQGTGIQVLQASEGSLPKVVALLDLFNSSSPSYIFPGYSPASIPVDLSCVRNDSSLFTCLMTFHTGSFYIFSIDFSQISSPKLALLNILSAYGTLSPIKGHGNFDSQTATIVVQNGTNQTMILYDTKKLAVTSTLFSQNISAQSLSGGRHIGTQGAAFTHHFPNGSGLSYVSRADGLEIYNHSSAVFIDFGNKSLIHSSYVTVFAVNEFGSNNYTFNITTDEKQKPSAQAWILVGILSVTIIVVILVGIVLEKLFANDKNPKRKASLREPLETADDRTTENVFRMDINETDSGDHRQEVSLQKRNKSDQTSQASRSKPSSSHDSGQFGTGSKVEIND